MKKKIIAFGEVMLRLSPWDKGERLKDANNFRIEPGGSEANVIIALAYLGNQTALVTVLPEENILTLKIKSYLRYHGVDDTFIIKRLGRVGLYWTENGIGPRNSFVQYDRENSAFSNLKIDFSEIAKIKSHTAWFHISGISPAVSKQAAYTVKKILDSMSGVPISIDLNFRNSLWKWKGASVKKYMREICKKAYLITANETDIKDALGYQWSEKNGIEIAEKIFRNNNKLKYLAVSQRISISASENKWTGFLYARIFREIKEYRGLSCHLNAIVDRIGSGDAFTAGVIHGIIHRLPLQNVINIAIGLGALKHTVMGDACGFNFADVKQFIKTKGAGRIIR